MITIETALKIVRKELDDYEEKFLGSEQLKVAEELTIEEDFGWVIFYNTRKLIEEGDLDYALAGNAPFIVDRTDGSLHATGTAEPIEYYIQQYRKAKGK